MLALIKRSLIVAKLLLFLLTYDVLAVDTDKLEALKKEAYESALTVLSHSSGRHVKAEHPAPASATRTWCATVGSTLKSCVERWQATANWTIHWQSEYDYPMLAKICFRGTFEQAMQGIIEAYKDAENPLYLDTYPEQRLVVISD